jgi:hypothetical protein
LFFTGLGYPRQYTTSLGSITDPLPSTPTTSPEGLRDNDQERTGFLPDGGLLEILEVERAEIQASLCESDQIGNDRRMADLGQYFGCAGRDSPVLVLESPGQERDGHFETPAYPPDRCGGCNT